MRPSRWRTRVVRGTSAPGKPPGYGAAAMLRSRTPLGRFECELFARSVTVARAQDDERQRSWRGPSSDGRPVVGVKRWVSSGERSPVMVHTGRYADASRPGAVSLASRKHKGRRLNTRTWVDGIRERVERWVGATEAWIEFRDGTALHALSLSAQKHKACGHATHPR